MNDPLSVVPIHAYPTPPWLPPDEDLARFFRRYHGQTGTGSPIFA